MKLSFFGFENSLPIEQGRISVLQIEPKRLFSRVCQSLVSFQGEDGLEPYSIWDGDVQIKPKEAFLPLVNIFDLPWSNKAILSGLYEKMGELLVEDEELRMRVEENDQALRRSVALLGFRLNGGYTFDLEWGLAQFLRSFSYGIDRSDAVSLLDNVIRFMELLHDARIRKTLVFVNISTFFVENELKEIQKQALFHGVSLLCLEHGIGNLDCVEAYKLSIDQDFFEKVS